MSDWRWAAFGFGLIAFALAVVLIVKWISDSERKK